MIKSKNTREEKLKLLQAIKDGKVNIESLQPPQTFIFIQDEKNPDIYRTMDGKEYTENEYQDFCKNIESRKNNSVIWNELKSYVQEDTILTFKLAEFCEPQKEMIIDVDYKP